MWQGRKRWHRETIKDVLRKLQLFCCGFRWVGTMAALCWSFPPTESKGKKLFLLSPKLASKKKTMKTNMYCIVGLMFHLCNFRPWIIFLLQRVASTLQKWRRSCFISFPLRFKSPWRPSNAFVWPKDIRRFRCWCCLKTAANNLSQRYKVLAMWRRMGNPERSRSGCF